MPLSFYTYVLVTLSLVPRPKPSWTKSSIYMCVHRYLDMNDTYVSNDPFMIRDPDHTEAYRRPRTATETDRIPRNSREDGANRFRDEWNLEALEPGAFGGVIMEHNFLERTRRSGPNTQSRDQPETFWSSVIKKERYIYLHR